MDDFLSLVAPPKEKAAATKKYVTYSKEEWAQVEAFFGRRVEAPELKAFTLALGNKISVALIPQD